MAAAEIMNLHTNFFDEVYESNFMMKEKKSEENENIETKNVNSTLFTSKVNNTFVDKSKLLRISSVDSSEDQIVSSSDFESGSSPLTDTTNEDDVDWDYLSEEDENDDVIEFKSQKNILSLDSDEDDEDDDMSNTIFSNKLLQPRQSSMIYTSSDNNHTVQNIRNENKNTIAAAVTTTTTTTTTANTTTNSNVNNQTTWNPFGIPIPPALVWFTVMKQQINQLPITRQDVTVTHSNHDHQHVDDDATSIQTLSNSGNISITTTTNNNIETTLSPPLNNNNNNVVMKKKKNRKPFTKEERKQRNREAAAESRIKKKKQLADLNNEILRLKNLVLHRDKHIEKLTNENLMLKSQLGLKTNNNNNNNSNDDDATQQQPPRKRKRIITNNNNNNMIKNSLKIGVACSMAMCLFTEDGTTTAFVFDHVSHVHNNILLMKFTNWFFTLTIFSMFLFSYIVINFELKKCKEKTTKFLLPLFTTTSKTRSKTSCSNNNNYNERKGVRIRRDEEDNKVFTYGNRRF